jgi:hypothetical protein
VIALQLNSGSEKFRISGMFCWTVDLDLLPYYAMVPAQWPLCLNADPKASAPGLGAAAFPKLLKARALLEPKSC